MSSASRSSIDGSHPAAARSGRRELSLRAAFWIAMVVVGLALFLVHLYLPRDIRARLPFFTVGTVESPALMLRLLGVLGLPAVIGLVAATLLARARLTLRAVAGGAIGTVVQTGLFIFGLWSWVPSWYEDGPDTFWPRLAWTAAGIIVAAVLLVGGWHAHPRRHVATS